MNKAKSIRLLGDIDIKAVQKVISRLSDTVWEKETYSRENNFKCFHTTKHFIFRFPHTLTDRTKVFSNPSWKIWEPMIMPLINKAVEPYGYKNGLVGTVMLANLLPKGRIDQHIDGSKSYYFLHKIHIPIFTNPNAIINIKSEKFNLEEGKAYELNNIVRHGALNDGDTNRIHLIFEYYNPEILS